MIINSILDNDLYKFTMQQAVIKHYPTAYVRYEFINRGKTEFPLDFHYKLENEIRYLPELKMNASEKRFLNNIRYFSPPYVDFLSGYKYNPMEVEIKQEGCDLKIVVEGPWYKTILWEVPLLALVSELYFREVGFYGESNPKFEDIALNKAVLLADMGAKFSDFGTRRRFSYHVQDKVIGIFKSTSKDFFNGTSNVHFASMHQVKAIGTEAHEWIQFHAAKYGFRLANQMSMEKWVDTYGGDLGIALADTFTSKSFFKSFDTKYAKLFDGVRQDSGDPLEFADMAIQHYLDLRIDPLTKTIVFSDGLDVDKVKRIEEYCKGRIKTSYGIGTNLTNDVGAKPLNIVIKMTACKPDPNGPWINTCKLSDSPGKYTGDLETIRLCKQVLGI